MKKLLFCIISCCIILSYSFANTEDLHGVWVATVYNLDYPSASTTDEATLKADANKILNNAYELGMNAVFLQVRPCADAFYKSNIYPWSKFLTGTNGTAPKNNFDPLEYWIKEAHARGIELHAWINPYRVTTNPSDFDKLSAKSPAKLHPEYLVKYSDGNYYFNPGIPEVRKLVIDGIMEIVNNYNIDGIHMDDYFYPSTSFDDASTFSKYGQKFSSLDDWRRNNVDLLIKEVGEKIKEKKVNVSFGISPAGIWANSTKNSLGSDTNGLQSYYSHYADTRKWALNNWIDYIAPQIYWSIGTKGSDYSILVNWWANTLKNSKTKLYIGMADYRTIDANSSSEWYNGKEIKKQIDLNRTNAVVKGEIHYRYASIIKNQSLFKILEDEYDNRIKVYIANERVCFDSEPTIISGRTLVPMRAIFEGLGATVDWKGSTQTVIASKGKTNILLRIGDKNMIVGKLSKELDVPAQLINARTYIPLRAVAEALDCQVYWNGNNNTISID